MKHVIFGLVLLLSAARAHAVVADQFSCEINITEVGKPNVTLGKSDFSVVRVPLSQSPAPDVRLTKAAAESSISTETSGQKIWGSVLINYTHAVRYDSAGKAIDARQTSCLVISGDYCSVDPKNPNGEKYCYALQSACMLPNDPFNPQHGWPTVSIAPDGTPMFDVNQIPPSILKVSDESKTHRATIIYSCQYKGTYT